jgi:hypothetical protein
MPTYDRLASFIRDYRKLSQEQRRQFRAAVSQFVFDLPQGRFRPGLRVKQVQGHPGVWELTWAPDGRATFEMNSDETADQHVIWRRIGTHDVFRNP